MHHQTSCGCKHFCSACVPATVQDGDALCFRWAVIKRSGTQAAKELTKVQSGQPLVARTRLAFFHAAVTHMHWKRRAAFCKTFAASMWESALKGIAQKMAAYALEFAPREPSRAAAPTAEMQAICFWQPSFEGCAGRSQS